MKTNNGLSAIKPFLIYDLLIYDLILCQLLFHRKNRAGYYLQKLLTFCVKTTYTFFWQNLTGYYQIKPMACLV